MPLIFPSNPSLNQVFDNGTFSFIWNGSSWVANGSPPSADLTINSANSAGSYANGAFAAANSAGNYANAAFLVANTSANVNTTQNTNISFAWNHANAAFNVANSSITTNPGTTGNVLTSNGNNWISQAAAAGGGDYIMQVFTTPGTWTKPAGLKAVKVTVIGGGGGGLGVGGTSSFGSPAFLSATGGATSSTTPSTGGSGSGGQINVSGGQSGILNNLGCPAPFYTERFGGGGAFGFGQARAGPNPGAGNAYGGGASGNPGAGTATGAGGGGAIEYIDAPALPGPQPYTVGAGGTGPAPSGVTGGAGVVIVEEFY
jgi:hypothetical protein